MLEVGVCGTDKEICAFAYGSPPPGSDHFVLGHESLGEVVETGPGVADLRAGDLVVSTVRLPCSDADCAPCRAGHYDFCMTGHYREHGIKGLDGFMTELVVEDRHNLHPVARDLRDVAVLVEPLTIAEKALIEVREIQQRLPWGGGPHRAVVLGAGPGWIAGRHGAGECRLRNVRLFAVAQAECECGRSGSHRRALHFVASRHPSSRWPNKWATST